MNAKKKYTAEQLRIAREIVDQEEAIEAERTRRGTVKRKAVIKRARKVLPARPIVSGRDRTMLIRLIAGPLAWWLVNGLLGLYSMSSPGGAYYHFWFVIPLGWIAVTLAIWSTPYDEKERPRFTGWLTAGVLFLLVLLIALSWSEWNCYATRADDFYCRYP
jgi:hypothetical protein